MRAWERWRLLLQGRFHVQGLWGCRMPPVLSSPGVSGGAFVLPGREFVAQEAALCKQGWHQVEILLPGDLRDTAGDSRDVEVAPVHPREGQLRAGCHWCHTERGDRQRRTPGLGFWGTVP